MMPCLKKENVSFYVLYRDNKTRNCVRENHAHVPSHKVQQPRLSGTTKDMSENEII